jgi:uncharacterized membrane protein
MEKIKKHNKLINRLLLLVNYFMWAKALHGLILNNYEPYWIFWILGSYFFMMYLIIERIDKESIYD